MKIKAQYLAAEGGLHLLWGCRFALPSPELAFTQLPARASASSASSKVLFPFSTVFRGSNINFIHPVSFLMMKKSSSSALTTLIPGFQSVVHWYCQRKKLTNWITAKHRHCQIPTCIWEDFDPSFEPEFLSVPHLQRLWCAWWCKAVCRWVRDAQPVPILIPVLTWIVVMVFGH